MGENAGKLRKTITDSVEQLSDTVDELSSKTDVVAKVRDTVASTADNVGQSLRTGTDNVRASIDETTKSVLDVAAEQRPKSLNPYVLGFGVIAIGLLAGIFVPLSDIERRRLKPIGDDLARRAADVRDEVVGQGTKVVQETISAAQDSAQRHGKELADHLGVSGETSVSTAAP